MLISLTAVSAFKSHSFHFYSSALLSKQELMISLTLFIYFSILSRVFSCVLLNCTVLFQINTLNQYFKEHVSPCSYIHKHNNVWLSLL